MQRWKKCFLNLKVLDRLTKLLIPEGHKLIEQHGFCDTSQFAYGTCVYVHSFSNHNWSTTFYTSTSKSRVAFCDQLPRLELCGAVLLI